MMNWQDFLSLWSPFWAFLNTKTMVFLEGAISLQIIVYIFDRYKNRKKLKLRSRFGARKDSQGNNSFELLVKNVGAAELGVHFYGFRTWEGKGVDIKHQTVIYGELLKPEQEELELAFYDGQAGEYLPFTQKEIYYYFVETGNKVFRKYTIFPLFAWIKRFWIYTKKYVERLYKSIGVNHRTS